MHSPAAQVHALLAMGCRARKRLGVSGHSAFRFALDSCPNPCPARLGPPPHSAALQTQV